MTNAATRFQPDISGNAVPSGFVGEVFGTQRSGTNGFSYSDTSTTTIGTSWTSLITRSLNKGIYLVSARAKCSFNTVGSAEFAARITIGGTSVMNETSRAYITGSTAATVCCVLPIFITADATNVVLEGIVGSGGTSNNSHEMSIIRLV